MLIRRGTCSFYIKAFNAQSAGAAAVVLYNNAAGALNPTVAPPLGSPAITIPVVAITAAQGSTLNGLIATGPTTLVWTGNTVGYPFGTGGLISGFSSFGLAADLALAGYRPMVINMSLGGGALEPVEQAALDRAIANGVIVVAAAGNEGETGMSYPGAYAPVISVGAVGWTGEWLKPTDGLPRYRMWWLQYPDAPMLPGSGEVADPTAVDDVYVTEFSSRGLPGQELDVLAPGSWVRGPFPGSPGYNHLPWWSKGIGDLVGGNGGNFYYVGGTSMATPHVAAITSLMLQKNPAMTQAQVEATLKGSALPVPAAGSRDIFDFAAPGTVTWDGDCSGTPCDAVGSGLVQADAALSATP